MRLFCVSLLDAHDDAVKWCDFAADTLGQVLGRVAAGIINGLEPLPPEEVSLEITLLNTAALPEQVRLRNAPSALSFSAEPEKEK